MVKVASNVFMDNKGNFPPGVNNVQTALDFLSDGSFESGGGGYVGGETDYGVTGAKVGDVAAGSGPAVNIVGSAQAGVGNQSWPLLTGSMAIVEGPGGSISEATAGAMAAGGPVSGDVAGWVISGPTQDPVMVMSLVDPADPIGSRPDFGATILAGADAGSTWQEAGYTQATLLGYGFTDSGADFVPKSYVAGDGSKNRTFNFPVPTAGNAGAGAGEIIAFPGGAGVPVPVAIPSLGPVLPTRREVDAIAREVGPGGAGSIGHGIFGIAGGAEPLIRTAIAVGAAGGSVQQAAGIVPEVLLAGAPALVLEDNAPVQAGSGVLVRGATERLDLN